MSPEELRHLAYKLETGLDIVDLIERMGRDAVSVEEGTGELDFRKYAAEIEAKLRNSEVNGGGIVWVASQLATIGLKIKNEQMERREHQMLSHPSSQPASDYGKVLAWRQR